MEAATFARTLHPLLTLLLRLAHEMVRLLRRHQLEALRRLSLDELAPAVQVDDPLQRLLVGLVVLEFRVLQHKPSAVPVSKSQIHLPQVARFLCGLYV